MSRPPIRRVELGGSESGPGRVQLPGSIPVHGLASLRVAMDGEARSNGFGGWEYQCKACGKKLYEDGHGEMVDQQGEADCPRSEDGASPHTVTDVPLTWLNSFGVSLDEAQDRIVFHVSVGDPRGAMVMELRKVDGQLFLSVPSAEESHVTLEPVGNRGVYRIK